MSAAFTVTTYNVLSPSRATQDRYPSLPAQWLDPAQRLAAIAKHLQAFPADIICLQEVDANLAHQLEWMLRPLPYVATCEASSVSDRGGCAILYNFQTTKMLRLTGLNYDFFLPPSARVAQMIEVEIAGKTVMIASTHLAWDEPGTPSERQLGFAQARFLVDTIAQHFPSTHGHIVCGGLNATPERDVVKTMLAAGYRDSHHATLNKATCNVGAAAQVDYVLHDEALLAEAVPHALVSDKVAMPNEQEPSDHVAVSAKFSWRDA